MTIPRTAGYFAPAPPRVLAHRGLASRAPENTLLAFLTAIAAGAAYIETDVHASSDGVAIIAHDPDLRRLAGRDARISDLAAAELGRIDLGAGQSFATLAEALDAFPETRFNVDIKSADAVVPTIGAIRAARAVHRVLVTSFDGRRSAAAVRALPGIATSASAGRLRAILLATAIGARPVIRRLLEPVDALQIPERYLGIRILSTRLIDAAHESGVEVHIWTVNDRADMERLLAAGVDGLVTDRADLALEVLAEAGFR